MLNLTAVSVKDANESRFLQTSTWDRVSSIRCGELHQPAKPGVSEGSQDPAGLRLPAQHPRRDWLHRAAGRGGQGRGHRSHRAYGSDRSPGTERHRRGSRTRGREGTTGARNDSSKAVLCSTCVQTKTRHELMGTDLTLFDFRTKITWNNVLTAECL